MTGPLSFTRLGLSGRLVTALTAHGFRTPTEVQARVIPRLLVPATDALVQAPTGTPGPQGSCLGRARSWS